MPEGLRGTHKPASVTAQPHAPAALRVCRRVTGGIHL